VSFPAITPESVRRLLPLRYVRVEERVRQQTFGDGDAQYRRRVRRGV
jgi:hypothetical protein